jgi:DNA-binding HxlR family transcriptional regulator
MAQQIDLSCPINRSLSVLGERWTLRILREATLGATRFGEFRERLGIAPDVLSDRLGALVEHGVLERVPYREPGARAREAYRLTESGRELSVLMSALGQWGHRHLPCPVDPALDFRCDDGTRSVHAAFVDADGREVPTAEVAAVALPPAG